MADVIDFVERRRVREDKKDLATINVSCGPDDDPGVLLEVGAVKVHLTVEHALDLARHLQFSASLVKAKIAADHGKEFLARYGYAWYATQRMRHAWRANLFLPPLCGDKRVRPGRFSFEGRACELCMRAVPDF